MRTVEAIEREIRDTADLTFPRYQELMSELEESVTTEPKPAIRTPSMRRHQHARPAGERRPLDSAPETPADVAGELKYLPGMTPELLAKHKRQVLELNAARPRPFPLCRICRSPIHPTEHCELNAGCCQSCGFDQIWKVILEVVDRYGKRRTAAHLRRLAAGRIVLD